MPSKKPVKKTLSQQRAKVAERTPRVDLDKYDSTRQARHAERDERLAALAADEEDARQAVRAERSARRRSEVARDEEQ